MQIETLERIRQTREKSLLDLLQAKKEGARIIGIYCAYTPRELVLAAGAIPVSLCGDSDEVIPFAEKHLPRNLCPLVKSSYGLALTDTCPFFHLSELVIGETTCDGKKKMFELLKRLKPCYIMNLPQIPDLPVSLELWHQELLRLKNYLEAYFQKKITEEDLWKAIRITNAEARAAKKLFDLNRRRPALLSGLDLITISYQTDFALDPELGIEMIEKLVEEVEDLARSGYKAGDEKTPRILLTGTPVGEGSEKVVAITEECGGLVVAMENCGGYKTVDLVIDENSDADPLYLLAQKYLAVPCSVMSPNNERLKLIEKMINDFQIDGVIDLTWQACHTYNIESFLVSELVKDKLGLPYLHLETDYSRNDIEILRVRIETFLEMIRNR